MLYVSERPSFPQQAIEVWASSWESFLKAHKSKKFKKY